MSQIKMKWGRALLFTCEFRSVDFQTEHSFNPIPTSPADDIFLGHQMSL